MSGQVISAVNLTNGNKHSIGLPYGVCSTAKDTAAKTVTVNGGDGFVLEAGAMVVVKFTNANSIASPTLNVNGTGAKSICRYGTTKASTGTTTTGWVAGAVQTFVYDGTNWIREYWNNTTYSNASLGQGYAIQDNTAQAAAITATLGSYSLTAGGVVAFKANYNVLANSTLNINEKGAKPIWFRGLAIANNIIKAGDVATLIYDGTNYHLLAIDRWQNDIKALETEVAGKSGILVVNINGGESGYYASKTFSEITTALSQNNMVYCDVYYMGFPLLLPITMLPIDTGMVMFSASSGNTGLIVLITSDNQVTVEEFDYISLNQLNEGLSTKVPISRTVNGKALSSNITLSANDVGASATGHKHAATDITSGTLSSDRLPVVPVVKGGTGTGFSLIDSADLKENPRVLLLKEDANGSRYFDAYTSLPVRLGGLGTRMIGNAQDNSLLVKQTDGNGEPFIDYTAHPKVESIAVGNCTINYDDDTNFLEFIFTSTTDTGTEG